MADYKELIRKAIQALPENNGAARRAVYEKARAALVGQLRGLNPPLAARDITQHRLQLEDCIRQVEQEASEQVIAGLKQNEDYSSAPQGALPPPRANGAARPGLASTARPALTNGATRPSTPPPVSRSTASPAPRQSTISATPRAAAASASRAPAPPAAVPRNGVAAQTRSAPAAMMPPPPPRSSGAARPVPRATTATSPRVLAQPEPELESEFEPDTIEEIIAAAETDGEPMDFDQEPEVNDDEPEPPMFRIEQRSSRKPAAAEPRVAEPRAAENRPLPAIVARAEAAKAARPSARAVEPPPRRGNGTDNYRNGTAAPARPQLTRQALEPIRLPRSNANAAMSSIREVDLEGPAEGDPQIAIERAIATLEREARNDGEDAGEDKEELDDRPAANGRRRNGADAGFRETSNTDTGFARAPVDKERGGGSAVTIFLLVFLVLLVAVGGGGFWAWREGFIDFDAMFGKAPTTATAQTSTRPASPAVASAATPPAQTNTEPAPTAAQSNQALSAAPASSAPAPTPAAEPSAQTGAPKSEERLSQSADSQATPATPDASTPAPGAAAAPGGSQSLLLEASQDGTTGAVPFSGTVEWSKGTDEMGQPTLIGKASIPARNLGVNVLIRKNTDPALPASHLMEINFTVSDSFIGGAIAGLPGVLLKNEELVQGTPLVGASARVVGNSFLFALSSSAADEQTNKDLLTSRKWMDLAIIYATGKKAIITLEKDDKTEQLFNDVFAAWAKETPVAAAPAPAAK